MKRVLGFLTFCFVVALIAFAAGCAQPADNENTASRNGAATTASPSQPAQSSPTVGSLAITSKPEGASILLMLTDEGGASPPQSYGATPSTLKNLSPGKYTVHLELSGYKAFQKEVEVKAGEIATVNATLQK